MKMSKASIILMVAVLAVTTAAFAAPIPVGSITDSIGEPSRVALDAQGNVYVSEPSRNIVRKFDSQGKQLGSFAVERPYGLAVSSSGTIYVCSVQVPQKKNKYVNKSAVYMFAPDFSQAGMLGGAGEFSAPVDIAIDKQGNIYVVDMDKNHVKVYTAAGSSLSAFGGLGNGLGKLNKPMGISINDAAGVIYVVDKPDYTDANGTTVGARVQTFDMNGVSLSSFGQYGEGVGQISSPVDVAFDKAGNLYISDSRQSQVHIFKAADGAPAGTILQEYAYAPAGLAVSGGDLLYVVWQRTATERGRVDSYGLEGYVTMDVTPPSLVFEARQSSGNPAEQTVVIANAGTGTLNWGASTDQAWLTVGPQAAVGSQSSTGLKVGINAANMTAGSYTGAVTIVSNAGVVKVGVTLTVLQPLVLNISDWSPTFSVKKDAAPVSAIVMIGIDGGAGNWNITGGMPSWLSVAPLSGGSAPTAVTFTVNPAGLAPQADPYVAFVPVSASGVIGDGGKFTVSLSVNSTTKLSVSTNNAAATFEVKGPSATYQGSGLNWSMDNVAAGDYTVTYNAVAGFKKPVAQAKTLAADGEVSFNGAYASYADLAAKKNIVAAQGPAASNDAGIKVFKNNGQAVPFDLTALTTMYGANIAAGDVDGDGAADLIVGAGNGKNNPAVVRIFRAADKAMIAEFTPFATLNGAGVAAGDIDGDGKAEVLVADTRGQIDIFTYVDGRMSFTGASVRGAAAAVVDTVYDGKPEVVTVSRNGMKIWNVDLAAGTATLSLNRANVTGTSVAAGDFDGDGDDEVLIGGLPTNAGRIAVSLVEPFGARTTLVTLSKSSASVAAADLDGDGIAEAVVGTSNDAGRPTVHVYGADGARKFAIKTFNDANAGINVAVGDLGL